MGAKNMKKTPILILPCSRVHTMDKMLCEDTMKPRILRWPLTFCNIIDVTGLTSYITLNTENTTYSERQKAAKQICKRSCQIPMSGFN